MESDLEALVRIQGDACLWLDASATVQHALGAWPAVGDGAPLVGRKLRALVPPAVLRALRKQGRADTVRWRVPATSGERIYELRVARLGGNRWLLTARELVAMLDPLLQAECARLRSQVADLTHRLRQALDAQQMFRARLAEEVARAARSADPVSVLRLDLHDFESYRSRFGEQASERVMGAVDQSLRRDTRSGDFLARWDQRGFALLLPQTDAQAARLVAERHQRGIGAIHWPHDDIGVRVGVATLWRDAAQPDDLLRLSQPVH